MAARAEGGWDGRDGSALAASAQLHSASSACTRGRRRRNERLLRWTHVEATCAGHCPLAAGGGEVNGALEPRRAMRHGRRCQRTPPTRLRAPGGSSSRWPPQHAFGSGSLASGAACSRTLSPSGLLQNPISAAPTRVDTGGSSDGTPRCTTTDVTTQGDRRTHGHPRGVRW
jgi:hypothetical protein